LAGNRFVATDKAGREKMSNERAAVWIRARGYEPEPEPGWVTGRKPDFFCAGKAPFWVEVKTFEPTAYDLLQGRAWQDFRARINRLKGLTGSVHASISPTFSELSGKRAAHLVRHLAKAAAPDAKVREVIFIPADAIEDTLVTIQYMTNRFPVVQIGPRSQSGKYGYYSSYEPAVRGLDVEISDDGNSTTRRSFEVFDGWAQSPITVAYYRSDSPLHLASMGSGMAMPVNTTERLRSAIDEANDQIRSGQAKVPAPGLCVVYHDSLDATSGQMYLAALFGDLTVAIDLAPICMGEAFLGRNAILTPQQNRGVSAVRYVTANYGESIALNPYAEFPIDRSLFGDAPVWVLDGSQMVLSPNPGKSAGVE
jgi:hypothetical protein